MPDSVFLVASLRRMKLFSGFLFAVVAAKFEFAAIRKQKNTLLMTVSMETVRMVKYRLGKNQSERLDLPQDCLSIYNKHF